MEKKRLDTLKEIAQCAQRSADWCREKQKTGKFPMKKLGGRWISHADLIDEWWKSQASSS